MPKKKKAPSNAQQTKPKQQSSASSRHPTTDSRQNPPHATIKKQVISWPLKNHHFRLVCCQCYIKVKEGIGGEVYKKDYPHSCCHDHLIVLPKDSPHLTWKQIRCRPVSQGTNSTAFNTLCKKYQSGEKCSYGTGCLLPHNYDEMRLWELERNEIFNIECFIKEAQNKNIFSSEMPGIEIRLIDALPAKTVRQTSVTANDSRSSDEKIPPTKTYKPKVARRYINLRPGCVPSHLTNPLESEFGLFCSNCLVMTGTAWFYLHQQSTFHNCPQNILAYPVQDSAGQTVWSQVRERANDYSGNYAMCYSVQYGNPNLCSFKDECHFLHSEEEKVLWKLDQENVFDIGQFISHHRNRGVKAAPTPAPKTSLSSLVQKFGGYFIFICRSCLVESSFISQQGSKNECSGRGRHTWQSSKVLAFVRQNQSTKIDIIDKRKFLHQGAYFSMCKWAKGNCRELFLNRCRFAHSIVEKAVWEFQQETLISEDEMVRQSHLVWTKLQSAGPQAWGQSWGPHGSAQQTSQHSFAGQKRPEPNCRPTINLTQVCGQCWAYKHICSEEVLGTDKCVRGHSNFQLLSAFVSLPSKKEIRKLPGHLYRSTKLVLCHFMTNCTRSYCGFPHGLEELAIWQWMLDNGVKNLKDVADRFRQQGSTGGHRAQQDGAGTSARSPSQSYAERVSGQKTSAGSSNIPRQDAAEDNVLVPGQIHAQAYYCQYCGRTCNSDKQWDEHCMSEAHISQVNSDKEHQWNFRPPPWGRSSNLVLCYRHIHNKSCQYSYVPDNYNLCSHAHSQEELDEWQERHEWRQMKKAVARDSNMFSYTETLLDDYYSQGDSINVICENIPGVQIESDQENVVYRSKKNDIFTWAFFIHTNTTLEKVALLFNKDRPHFKLVSISEDCEEQHQVASGDLFLDIDEDDKACYKVNVCFSGSMFGSFTQWVVFDFGSRPVLVKKLSVEIGDQIQQEKVKKLRQKLTLERWTRENREIVLSPESLNNQDKFNQQLLLRYKEPLAPADVITSHSWVEINQHNYVHKMHNLLDLEEFTRQSIIASHNLATDVTVSQFVGEKDQAFLIGRDGDLFGKVTLAEYLTTDSVAGKLLLSSVKSALVARAGSQLEKVYEVDFVGEHNYDFDGRSKEYIYIVISAKAAQGLGIGPGQTVAMEIQFQLDRSFFCRLHYALDSMRNLQVVFPDVIKFKPDVQTLREMAQIGSQFLNEDQLVAVRHIVVPREGVSPPLIMYGPFGTGKTETIAQATIALLATQKDQCRILICTQSNSAADLYITKHFDQFFKKYKNFKMLRLVAEGRKFAAVPEEVRAYCHYSDEKQFYTPSNQEIKSNHVVLTTVEKSLVLTNMRMYGDFTHIFVDEAGQITECEALMPLSLATSKTCVVLTGDHNQIGPTVYSLEARCQNFGVSLLQRLYNYYLKLQKCEVQELAEKCQQSPLTIFLRMNYRTKLEILEFISTVFYNGPESLKACGDIPDLIEIPPLAFYVVQGKEIQTAGSISYLNVPEAQEVLAKVIELLENWPLEWGPMDPRQVAVISTYSDQIKYIRTLFRRDKGRPFLKFVDVGPIHSFQGKEKIALFITTVRTCHLLKEQHIIRALREGDGIDDLGFLSSREQLNTALTRTRSHVAVVGDPVALCLIGKCKTVWKTYLKYCSKIGSIFPQAYTWNVISNMAIDLSQRPESCIIDLISEQYQSTFRDCGKKLTPPVDQTASPDSNETEMPREDKNPSTTAFERACKIPVEEELSEVSGDSKVSADVLIGASHHNQKANTNASLETKSKKRMTRPHFNELSVNESISSEDILIYLAQENLGEKTEIFKNKPQQLDDIFIAYDGDGIATITQNSVDSAQCKSHKPFAIVTDDDDFVISTFDDEDTGTQTHSQNWGRNTLLFKLAKEPNKFFKCKIIVKNRERAMATVLGPPSVHNMQICGKDIEVQGSVDRGHALHGDIVVVQVMKTLENGQMKGQVKGILKRAENLDRKLYLCEADVEDNGILKPINTALPFTHLLTNNLHKPMVRKGYICVYKLSTKNRIKFSHYEKLDFAQQGCVLFVTRYLCWQPNFALPCGIVIGLIKNDSSLLKGMKIMEVEHSIKYSCGKQAELDADTIFPSDSCVPAKFFSNRQDLRHNICFTIEDEQNNVKDMAVSVKQADKVYEVTLHVTDVAAFVDKDSALDLECAGHAVSLFPLGKEPRHMLPLVEAVQMCSFEPGFDRLAISVVLKVDNEGKLCEEPSLFLSIINNKRCFSHAEIEEIILDPERSQTDVFESRVLVLSQLTSIWREQRLGNSHICMDLEPEKKKCQHSFMMMNEIKIQFDGLVANFLLSRYPNETPLLVQPCPESETLERWRTAHACFALNSLCLIKAFLDNSVCRCDGACTCIFNYKTQHMINNVRCVAVLKQSWLTICEAVKDEDQDIDFAQELIASSESLPQVWLAAHKLEQIVPVQTYRCSGSLPSPLERMHYNLCLQATTNFTSSMKSFLSLVVQRMLKAYTNQAPSPYSPDEMEILCESATLAEHKALDFHRDMFLLHLCSALRSRPVAVTAVIEDVNTETLRLSLGLALHMAVSQDISLQLLSPVSLSAGASGQVQLGCLERIYNTAVAPPQVQHSSVMQLNPDTLVCNIPFVPWQKLLQAVRQSDKVELVACVKEISDSIESEIENGTKSQVEILSYQSHQYAPFSLSLSEGQSILVQMYSKLHQGHLQPCVQLLQLSPGLDICLEHRTAPEECFTTLQGITPHPQAIFSDEQTYLCDWLLPAHALESAHKALETRERVTIHRINITWEKADSKPDNVSPIKGMFTLTKEFCERSSFWPNSGSNLVSDLLQGQAPFSGDANFSLDYLCVRYSGFPSPTLTNLESSVDAVINNDEPVTWVGHCCVTKVTESRQDFQVDISLVQSSTDFPELLGQTGHTYPCTVEWISKTEEHRIMDTAARGLTNASEFVKDIITGRKPVNTVDPLPLHLNERVLHPRQDEIVTECYRQPFVTVVGGFGTGKSTVIACLAHLLVNRNTTVGMLEPRQLMICGPTEESLDILTGYLLRLQSVSESIVRVYSRETEEKEFPTTKSHTGQQPNGSVMKDVALHHLIRSTRSSPGKRLLKEENRPMDERSLDYKGIVEKAQQHFLTKAKIILCTCITSARSVLRSATNIKQIIMDDAGMIPEIETLVPLVMHKNVNQLAIFGDLKMPFKKMGSSLATKFGLARPLLQRFAEKAKLLEDQFRTTAAMASFPSTQFYKKGLRTLQSNRSLLSPPQTLQWPGQPGKTCVFCHIKGSETLLDGESSRLGSEALVNYLEMQAVTVMVNSLISDHKVRESSILVIAATKAQVSIIKKFVPESVAVCTVIDSLGKENNYVVLSTVRSSPCAETLRPISANWVKENLGNIAEPGVVNLAITRARTGLFILGDKYTLSACQAWRSLLASYRQQGCLVMDTPSFLQSLATS